MKTQIATACLIAALFPVIAPLAAAQWIECFFMEKNK